MLVEIVVRATGDREYSLRTGACHGFNSLQRYHLPFPRHGVDYGVRPGDRVTVVARILSVAISLRGACGHARVDRLQLEGPRLVRVVALASLKFDGVGIVRVENDLVLRVLVDFSVGSKVVLGEVRSR